jgi:hypothetical protein
MAGSGEAVRQFFAAYARATASVDTAFLESAYAEQFMFGGPGGVRAVRREDFLKVVPKRKAFFSAVGLRSSEILRLEEHVLDEQYVQVKVHWAFVFEKEPGRPILDEGATTYVLRRQGGQLQIVFHLDHQDLTRRVQELGLLPV